MKFHKSKWKFKFFIRILNSSQVDLVETVADAIDAGIVGLSLKKISVGNEKIVTAIHCQSMSWYTSSLVAPYGTKIGPRMNPAIPPIIKARDYPDTAMVLSSGPNHLSATLMVAI